MTVLSPSLALADRTDSLAQRACCYTRAVHRPLVLLFVAVVVATGCAKNSKSQGNELEPCFPNNTCLGDLTCASGICVHVQVDPPDAGDDAVRDAMSLGDDGGPLEIEDGGALTDSSTPDSGPTPQCVAMCSHVYGDCSLGFAYDGRNIDVDECAELWSEGLFAGTESCLEGIACSVYELHECLGIPPPECATKARCTIAEIEPGIPEDGIELCTIANDGSEVWSFQRWCEPDGRFSDSQAFTGCSISDGVAGPLPLCVDCAPVGEEYVDPVVQTNCGGMGFRNVRLQCQVRYIEEHGYYYQGAVPITCN